MMDNFSTKKQSFSLTVDEFYLDLQNDGKSIARLSQEKIEKKPFPGLRSFRTSEFTLFKGRGNQIQDVLNKLNERNFLAIIGSSGTGKSSLVRAGLIPHLFGGFLKRAGIGWDIAICRPGNDPINNLAVSLSSLACNSKEGSKIAEEHRFIYPLLLKSTYGILNVGKILREKNKSDSRNLLIIIDQFEEIFRYDQKKSTVDNVQNYFVDLLLNASSNNENKTYVIITMRSEFLGNVVKYKGLPEAINEGQYLVPQLNPKQLWDVIEGPILRAKKKIETPLVQLLINEIEQNVPSEDSLDYLPILQHALMRTYDHAIAKGKDIVEIEDYIEIGQMSNALSKHAESVFMELSNKDELENINKSDIFLARTINIDDESWYSKNQRIAKILFQAITDNSTDLKGGRRPTKVKDVCDMAKAKPVDAEEFKTNFVINHFRKEETSFIQPSNDFVLSDELKLDISHESLMRNWPRLKKWMADEVKYGELYKTLNERRKLLEDDKDDWVKAGLLEDMIAWRDHIPHSATWSSRYQVADKDGTNILELNKSNYKKNLDYLDESVLKQQEEIKQKIDAINAIEKARLADKEVQLTKKGNKILIVSSIMVIIVIAIFLFGQVRLTNVAFSIAAITKIDTISDKERALKILITAHKNFRGANNDSLIKDGFKSSEKAIKNIFNENNLTSDTTLKEKGYQAINYLVFNNDSSILVGYSNDIDQSVKPIKNLTPITRKINVPNNFPSQANIVYGNPGSLYNSPIQSMTVLYNSKGEKLNHWKSKVYSVENSNYVAEVFPNKINLFKDKDSIPAITIRLNEPKLNIASLKYSKDKKRILINSGRNNVEVFDNHGRSILKLTNSNKNRNENLRVSFSGQFLDSGNILLVESDTTYVGPFPLRAKYAVQIFYKNEDYKKSGPIYNDLDKIIISPDKKSFITEKENDLELYNNDMLIPIKDTLSKKRIKYDAKSNFIVYNLNFIHVFNGHNIKDNKLIKFNLNNSEDILDFKNNLIVKGTINGSRFRNDSISDIEVFDLKTSMRIKTEKEVLLKSCLLSNNADSMITLSTMYSRNGQSNMVLCKIYSIKERSREKELLSSFTMTGTSCLALDNTHYRRLGTDFYSFVDEDIFFNDNFGVITRNSTNTQSTEIKLFNIQNSKLKATDNIQFIIPYFNKRYPTTTADESEINTFLHTNNSFLMKIANHVVKLFEKNKSNDN